MTLLSQSAVKLGNDCKKVCWERTPLDANKFIYWLFMAVHIAA